MSPTAVAKACSVPGCGVLVAHGRCVHHARQADRARGSAAARGYDRCWRARRTWFFHRLLALGMVPVCGARLPGAPETVDGLCAAEGQRTLNDRHVDHIVPHRGADDPNFWDPLNWQVL